MYKEDILDLYRNPLNEGRLEKGLKAEGDNPNCGDETTVYVEVEDGKVRDVGHETSGCAISTAAVSLVSEEVQGMEVEEVLELDRDWVVELMGVEISPMRMKCALLGLETVQRALEEEVNQ